MLQARQLDRVFAALADPRRRGIVERLAGGPATVKELAGPAGMRLPSALKHLRVLEDGGIVISRKVGRARTYRMRPDAFRAVDEWVLGRKAAMNAAFDRLAEAMGEIPEEDGR